MGITVGANFLSMVHKDSGGVAPSFPDVCKTPAPPAPFAPIPYPNIAKSSDADKGAKKVNADGNPVCTKDSNFSTSTGDEAGTMGGMVSAKTKGKAEFVNSSFDVKAEGTGVVRATDLMLHNDKNTPPFPLVQGPVMAMEGSDPDEDKCTLCGEPLE